MSNDKMDIMEFGAKHLNFELAETLANSMNGQNSNDCIFTLSFLLGVFLARINIQEADPADMICSRSADMAEFMHNHAHSLFERKDDPEVMAILGKIEMMKGKVN